MQELEHRLRQILSFCLQFGIMIHVLTFCAW